MVTLKNDDQGFASSNHTGTIFFYQSKVASCVILFVCLFDLILYVPPTIFQCIKGQVFLGEAVLS